MIKLLSSSPVAQQSGLAVIRITVGLLMVYHGWEVFDNAKMEEYAKWESFNSYASPAIMVYIGKGAELIAGVLMTLGLLTRIAALVLVITMLYICFKIGNGRFWYENQHPFLFVLIGMVYFFVGGGKYSMDSILFRKY